MMSPKLATLFKIKIFSGKDYDVKISVHDVINKILSRESNYIVSVVMWPKWGAFRLPHPLPSWIGLIQIITDWLFRVAILY